MNWETIVSRITPSVVRITTPDGCGTGFLCLNDKNGQWIGIATAAHVVSHAQQWDHPIRISSEAASTTQLIYPAQRRIFLDAKKDSAVLLVEPLLELATYDPIPLLPSAERIPIGASVGWLGFPADTNLCFFTGTVSAIETDPAK